MRRIYISALSLLLIVIVAVFFVVKEVRIDSNLYDRKDCKVPCWHNLIPGQSSLSAVDNFIKTLNAVTWPERNIRTVDSGCKWIRVVRRFPLGVVDFYLENGTLMFIKSSGSVHASLEKIISRFDEPEYYQAIFSEGPDGDIYFLEIYYPSQGLAFKISALPKDAGYIKPNMQANEVHYFPVGDIHSYFTTRYSCEYGQEDAITESQRVVETYVQAWSGFGKVKIVTLP
jgi:hypothetical protein